MCAEGWGLRRRCLGPAQIKRLLQHPHDALGIVHVEEMVLDNGVHEDFLGCLPWSEAIRQLLTVAMKTKGEMFLAAIPLVQSNEQYHSDLW